MRVKLWVEDAYGDNYERDFLLSRESLGDVECPDCGTLLTPLDGVGCANGHLAYTIVDDNVLDKISSALVRLTCPQVEVRTCTC